MKSSILKLFSVFSAAGAGTAYTDHAGLEALMTGKEPYILVDVRSPDEFASGHIPTAVNIPHTAISQKPPTADKDALIILYCLSGGRSGAAQGVLKGMGYSRVHNFGSVSHWRKPLAKGA